MTVLPPSLTALESLPRVELQSLLKLHGLKGANKKVRSSRPFLTSRPLLTVMQTSDMVDILTEFFQEKALSGETVPYPLLNNEENMVKEDADIAVAAEPATAFVEIQEQILEPKVPTLDPIEPSTIVSEDCTKATEESPVEAEEGATQLAVRAFLRRSVPEENGDDLVSLMEKEGLLDWVLLRSLTLQDMRSMGLTMGLALRLLLAIKGTSRAIGTTLYRKLNVWLSQRNLKRTLLHSKTRQFHRLCRSCTSW